MDDDELAQIRAKRLAEMQAKQGMSGMPGLASNIPGQTGKQEDADKQRAQEDARKQMLAQILESDARERLGRVSLTKPENARLVEDYIIQMARSGRLGGKVSEKDLIGILEQVAQQKSSETKIVYNRRRYDDDDDLDL